MKFLQSLRYAFGGLITFFRSERNGQIQVVVAVAVVSLAAFLKTSAMEWLAVVLCIIIVCSFEMINTAIEKLCDVVHPDFHPQIRVIKDVAAGAVLMAAVGSVVAGVVIFLPKIIALLQY